MKQTSEVRLWKECRRGINTVNFFPRKDAGKKLGRKLNDWLAGLSPKNLSSVFELGHSSACLICDRRRWGMELDRPKYHNIFKYRKMVIFFLLDMRKYLLHE